jgi:hypothetical protein
MNTCCKHWSWVFALVACGAIAWSMSAAESATPDDAADQCVKLAREIYAEMVERARNAAGYDMEDFEHWSRNLLNAELDTATNQDQRAAAHAAHVRRTREIEELAKNYARQGEGRQSDALAAEFYRLQAERTQAQSK